MTRYRFPYVLTLSLATVALGAVGCANSHSPTEPSSLDALAKSSVAPVSEESGGGGDESALDKRRGRGADDPAGDDHGRRGRGRGNDRPDDRQQPPRVGQEFEGSVVAVNGQTLGLAGGARITVDGRTQWNARGDLVSLNQVAASVAAAKPTRVEGRGVRQADGSLLAQTIKAEVDN